MKKILIFLVLTFGIFSMVSPWKAMKIAQNWVELVNYRMGKKIILDEGNFGFYSPKEISYRVMNLREAYFKGEIVGYIAELYPAGYILIPGTEVLSPVKLYSLRGKFLPEKIGFQKDVLRLLHEAMNGENEIGVQASPKWELIVSAKPSQLKEMASRETIFGPIVETRWNQTSPYNLYTPEIGGSHTPTGCVATAYAQILKFWDWPDRGKGSYSYYWVEGGRTLSANFDHPYHWDRMPDSLSDSSPEDEKKEVARLMYDIGVSLEMDYESEGSAAYPSDAIVQFPKYFKYSHDINYIQRCNLFYTSDWTCVPGHFKPAAVWFQELKGKIDQFEPFEFSIYAKSGSNYEGHAVVVDGYEMTDSSKFIHINMGWGGSSDAFYSVDNILNFNILDWQSAIINIYPENLPSRPRNVSAKRHVDRGVFVYRYMDEVTWDAPSSGEGGISKYQVLRWDRANGIIKVVAEVKVEREREAKINVGTQEMDYKYAVLSVAKDGKRGKPTSFVSPLKGGE